jgi:hypothetical protein
MELTRLDARSWEQSWQALPVGRRETYFHPDYAAVCGTWERAAPVCHVLRDGDRWMLHAVLEHAIPETVRHDTQTPYGYGGPLFVGQWPPDDRVAALSAVADHFRKRGAVAEFVRCHTEWTDVESLAAAGYRVFQVRTNVECDLGGDDFTTTWSGGARRNLRNARAAGLRWRIGTTPAEWEAFEALYARTARRLEMAPVYRFDTRYFTGLSAVPGVKLVLVDSPPVQSPLAAAVVFLGGELAHYHLGASDFAHQHLRPNEMLYFAMATCARDAGCRRIVWGGGLSNDPADSLFRFKSHFGAIRRPAYGAGRVLDPGAYDRLCHEWERRNPGQTSKLFLKYRAVP